MLKIKEKREVKLEDLKKFSDSNMNIIGYRILLNTFKELDEDIDAIYKKYREFVIPKFNQIEYFSKPLPGLNESKELIKIAIEDKKKILAISDFDCDGINSAVVIHKFFKYVFKYPIDIVVNKRKFGNGVNISLLETIENIKDYDLLITSDHGSSSEEGFKWLKEINPKIKILVTDHHTIPEDNYPKSADVIVNPFITENAPYKNLSGCAIAFLTMANVENFKEPEKWVELSNLVADNLLLTVISDVMDVTDPFNRWICYSGLNKINTSNSTIFNIVKNYYRFGKIVTIENIRFNISPLINSGNRTHNEETVYKFLTSEDPDEMISLLEVMNTNNKRRREYTNSIITKAIENDSVYGNNVSVIVINTDLGINGIIAGKIGEIYQKPCVCFIGDGEHYHGSCRSIIPGFSILEKMKQLKEEGLVEKCGGHDQACGCMVNKDNLVNFIKRLDEISSDVKPRTHIDVDAFIDFNDINIGLAKEVVSLEPYGKNMEIPLFYSECIVEKAYHTDKMSYLTLKNENGQMFQACAFNTGGFDIKKELKMGYKAGIVYTLGMSYFKETHKLNMVVTYAKCLGFNENILEGVMNG